MQRSRYSESNSEHSYRSKTLLRTYINIYIQPDFTPDSAKSTTQKTFPILKHYGNQSQTPNK